MKRNSHFNELSNKLCQLTKQWFEIFLIILLFWLTSNKLFSILKHYVPSLFYFSFYRHETMFVNGVLDVYKLIIFSLVNIFSQYIPIANRFSN